MVTSDEARVVVVTGANGGIGHPMARTLVEDGYRVAGLDVEGETVESLRETAPDRVLFVECDVTDAEGVDAAVDAVLDRWGKIDVLVNLAGIATLAPFEERSIADARREFEVNYFGYLRTTRAVLPHMRERGEGKIHNVSSGTAFSGFPGLTGYAATKGAVEGFTRSLRMELRDEGVSVTLMHPPISDTRLSADLGFPDWMLNDPDEVGRKLARKVESTGPVVYADLRTRVGISLVKRYPRLWNWGIDRLVDTGG